MRLVSAKQMREMDQFAIEYYGIPQLSLMENAGKAVADEVIRTYGSRKWIILVGKGNNGGDGLVAARHLVEAGCDVLIVYAVDPDELQGAAQKQKEIIDKWELPVIVYPKQPIPWPQYDGIIDALLGTGTAGAPREPVASLIREANESGLTTVAVDIPSGIDADSGKVYEPCIRAQITIALAMVKQGMVQYPAADYCGEIRLCRIGIPEKLADRFPAPCYYVDESFVQTHFSKSALFVRQADTHKGTYGHVLIAAGSNAYSGAGLLAAKAALRAGSGLVSWYLPATLKEAMVGHVPEAMLIAAEDDGTGDWSRCQPESIRELAGDKQALVIGPGLGRFKNDSRWIARALKQLPCPAVIDADALNMIADLKESKKVWRETATDIVITPHPGEMARLCNTTVAEVQANRILTASQFAQEHGITVVLKGARTVTATPDGTTYINASGNAGMATGGSGDVLAGLIGGLIAQGMPASEAAVLGVYWHGAAGDRALAKRPSLASLIASDLIAEL